MDSLHCEVQYVNVFSVWCSNFSSRGCLYEREKKEVVEERRRDRGNEQWAQVVPTSAFTSCVLPKGGRVEKEGWTGVSRKTSAGWRPFWRLQRSCTLEKKGCGVLNGTEEHTDKTWKEEGMPYNPTRPHAWFKEPVRNTEKSTRVKDRVEMMDLLRRMAFVAEGKGRDNGRLTGQKAAEFSRLFIWKQTGRLRQTPSNRIWAWSGFCLGFQKRQKQKRFAGAPCVALCSKSRETEVQAKKKKKTISREGNEQLMLKPFNL